MYTNKHYQMFSVLERHQVNNLYDVNYDVKVYNIIDATFCLCDASSAGPLKWIEQLCCHQFRSENSITVFCVSFFKD